MPIEELAHRMTMAGLEVDEIRYVGLPMPGWIWTIQASPLNKDNSGLEWSRDKLVVAAILEVMPHPNADRLVLCRLDDGDREHIVLNRRSEPVPL
jgi:phenylalanyl-tRNA synthetase beta chain